MEHAHNTERTIFTIEDPVEHEIEGIFQCEPNPSIGLTASNILRSLLRQDPNIIMIGEIRDAETAELSINAALTGHLVLATLHTNSALDAIHRCRNWNSDFFSLTSSLKLIIHQSMMHSQNGQRAIFSALKPLWADSLPNNYQEIITSHHLWKSYSQETKGLDNAMV